MKRTGVVAVSAQEETLRQPEKVQIREEEDQRAGTRGRICAIGEQRRGEGGVCETIRMADCVQRSGLWIGLD